jgi:DNA replication initiation complex subunit (GINS family)
MESVAQSQNSQQGTKEININYETLFELLRIEKNRDDLQELPQNFFEDVLAYMREKQQILDEGKQKEDLFSATEREKVITEMANIRKILRELYERREKKIISMALNKSRTRSNIIDTSKLLGDESRLFSRVVSVLDTFREGILLNVLDFRQPFVEDKKGLQELSQSKEAKNSSVSKETKLVRFLYPVPKFIGKELESYGPFEEEDMATLPSDIADLLIGKGRAEEMNEG